MELENEEGNCLVAQNECKQKPSQKNVILLYIFPWVPIIQERRTFDNMYYSFWETTL